MQVNSTTPLSRIEVACDMSGLTARGGTVLLSGLSDAIGLTDGVVQRLRIHSRSVRSGTRTCSSGRSPRTARRS